METIENELSIRGIFPDEEEPGLYAVYHASAQEEFEVEGGYRRTWEDSAEVKVESHVAGTLVVDLVDVKANRVVWRAIATATVTGDRKKARGRIPSVVQKMFADFPPYVHQCRGAPPPRPRMSGAARRSRGRRIGCRSVKDVLGTFASVLRSVGCRRLRGNHDGWEIQACHALVQRRDFLFHYLVEPGSQLLQLGPQVREPVACARGRRKIPIGHVPVERSQLVVDPRRKVDAGPGPTCSSPV